MSVSAVFAFFKALPEMVGLMREGIDAINNLRDSITTRKFDKLDAKIEEVIKEVKNETDRNRLLELAAELNKLQ